MATKADINKLVDRRVRDQSGLLKSDDIDSCIDSAKLDFDSHRPRLRHESVTGDGTATYDAPTGWTDEFSAVEAIEYPAGNQDPTYIDVNRVLVHYDTGTSAEKLRFRDVKPSASQTFVVRYTTPHDVPVTGSVSILAHDLHAFVDRAAMHAFTMLAARSTFNHDDTFDADVVDHGGQPERFRLLAADMKERSDRHLGITDDEDTAIEIVDLDSDYSFGRPNLIHTAART